MRDFVREAVFSMLGSRVRGARVLDLFAGSGSLGLEALSRGAEEAVFVDYAAASVSIIKENMDILNMSDKGTIIKAEILDYLRKATYPRTTYDLIFIDPPYKIDLKYRQEMLERIAEGGFMAPSAVLIIEAPLRSEPPQSPVGMRHKERRRYGDPAVDVYIKRENESRPEQEGL
jgi:16S rRNA (guanine966-N2)-methyltransferase